MRIQRGLLLLVSAGLVCLFAMPPLRAQTPPAESEIPLQRCDRLPVAIVEVNKTEKRFLIDTGATSMLNQKSFRSGRSTDVRIQSWNKTTSLSAREVLVSELSLGDHHLQNLKLPAIDLSAIAKACGGPIDGILGVDLLEQLGVTIDLHAPRETIEVCLDQNRFAQILANLLSNAAKFSPQHGCVDITVGKTEDRARIEVRDRGPGIPDDFKSRMGCHTRPRYFYVKVRDPLGSSLLRTARPWLFPPVVPAPERNLFK